MRQIDSILGNHGEIRAPMRRFPGAKDAFQRLHIEGCPIVTGAPRKVALMRSSGTIHCGAAERMESGCDYSVSQSASDG
jgi:hypothetical protein